MPDDPAAYRAETVRALYPLGFSFTPLDGKRPLLAGWQSRPRETLDQALEWAAAGNIGVRCGLLATGQHLVVLDYDSHHGAPPPLETLTVDTGGNGHHLYTLASVAVGNSTRRLDCDVKGVGGQVVAPGSVHPDTQVMYRWADGRGPGAVSLAPLPDELQARLVSPPARPAPSVPPKRPTAPPPRGSRYALTALQRELASVRAAPEGQRNDRLNIASFNLGTFVGAGSLPSTVADQLTDAALDAGLSLSEARATVESGLRAGRECPRKPPVRPVTASGHVQASLPSILTPGGHVNADGDYTEQTTTAFATQVLQAFPDDLIYTRDHVPGELIGAQGKRAWQMLTPERVILLADTHSRQIRWVKGRDGERVQVYCPCQRHHAQLVLAAAQHAEWVRDLDMLVHYPIYGPGFRRVLPGYHDRILYDEPEELADLVPERNTDVQRATLYDLLTDFPFRSDADLENFIGLMLTPLVAPAIDGNRPLHLLNAPLERTGKTKLAEDVFGGIIIGRQTPAMQITDRDDERDKRVTGLLMTGNTLLHLDNLPPHVDSGALSSLLTATTWSSRLLGYSRIVNLANNLTIVATGNNVQATGELIKRTVPIILQPTTENPEARRNFKHPNLRSYVRQQRKAVLSCLLGMVENWLAAGQPTHENLLGGFDQWSACVGGILERAGFLDWRTNEVQWRRDANPDQLQLEQFLDLWQTTFAEELHTATDLLGLADEHDLFPDVFARRTQKSQVTAFGVRLQALLDRPHGGFIVRAVEAGKRRLYRLEPFNPGAQA